MSDTPLKKLLIVEDDPGLQSQLKWHFENYEVIQATDRRSALDALRLHEPAVILQDLGLPPDPDGVSEGLQSVKEILELSPHTKVIVVTGNGDQDNAIRAIDMGATDFFYKPIDTDILDLIVQRAFNLHELENQNRILKSQVQQNAHGIVGTSPSMQKITRIIDKVAKTMATVLILGESGTGKEVVANALHNHSERSDSPFIAINCAAIPENLMESELFGYEKGAFTGANKQTAGKIEHANQGTLFLDEIGDMPLPLQAKLLRFLQERVIERLGGHKQIPVDVRVVAATNKNLQEMVAEGTFREDLYYRISEIVIDLPPLRDRTGDKTLLAQFFVKHIANQQQLAKKSLSSTAIDAIEAYHWPGNVREMENKIKRALIMADGKQLSADDLDLDEVNDRQHSNPLNLRQVRHEAEKNAIITALQQSEYNVSASAKLLGITRPTLYDLIKKHHINAEPS